MADKKISFFPQPPYLLNITSYDFWLFSDLKFELKSERFTSIEDIKINAIATPTTILREDYQRYFQ